MSGYHHFAFCYQGFCSLFQQLIWEPRNKGDHLCCYKHPSPIPEDTCHQRFYFQSLFWEGELATPVIPSRQDRQKQPKRCSCSSFSPYQTFAACSLAANSKEFLLFSTCFPLSDSAEGPPCSVPAAVRRMHPCHGPRTCCPASGSPQLLCPEDLEYWA